MARPASRPRTKTASKPAARSATRSPARSAAKPATRSPAKARTKARARARTKPSAKSGSSATPASIAKDALAHGQIQTLLSVYYHALDAADLGRLEREVMAEDATWNVIQVANTGRIEDEVSGRDDVLAWFRTMLGGDVSLSEGGVLHFLSTHAIEVDGDRATSTSHLQAVSQRTREILATGVAEAEHIRTSKGWRIRRYRVTERITDADMQALKQALALQFK